MSSHITDVEGDWKIVDYPQHPECVGCKIEIKGHSLDPNMFILNIEVVNHLNCNLQHNSTTDQWETSDFFTTEMDGSPEEMHKEHVFKKLILNLRKLEIHDEEHLIIKTNDHEQIRLEHLP
jgi:hypothetical protein